MSRRHSCWLSVVTALALTATPSLAQAETGSPITVSPGGEQALTEVERRCPTFSWGGNESKGTWELVVYLLEDDLSLPGVISDTARPVLAVELPGAARAWTPGLGQCLESGGRYAWAVRAKGADALSKATTSEWSEPRLFKIVASPSMSEVREAMAVLSAYLGAESIRVQTAAASSPDTAPADARDRTDQNTAESADDGVPTLGGAAAIRGNQTAVAGDASGVVGDTASIDGAGGVFGNMAGGPDVVLDGTADGETDTTVSQAGIDRSSTDPETFDIGNSGGGTMTLTVDGVEVVTTATDSDTQYTAGNQLSLNLTEFNVEEGSGSGLDADLLDGLDSTDFTAAGTDNWVDETGDTMTGTLTLNPAAGNAIATSNDIEIGAGSVRKGGFLFLHNQPNYSTGVGVGTLQNNTTGYSGTAVGFAALAANTTGIGNTGIGTEALENNTVGGNNTAVGRGALRYNTTGFGNTSVGRYSLRSNTSGGSNTAVGLNALTANTEGQLNTAMGSASLDANTDGDRNTAPAGYCAPAREGSGEHRPASQETCHFRREHRAVVTSTRAGCPGTERPRWTGCASRDRRCQKAFAPLCGGRDASGTLDIPVRLRIRAVGRVGGYSTTCQPIFAGRRLRGTCSPRRRGDQMTVASPCVGTCKLDKATGWCLGCARSGDEIAEWQRQTDAWRADVWDALPARFGSLGVRCRRLPWETSEIHDFVVRNLRTAAGTWVIGVVGAVAEFTAKRAAPIEVETDGASIVAFTEGGNLRFLIDDDVRAVTFEAPETPQERQHVVLAVKRERVGLSVATTVTDLGNDQAAIQSEDRRRRLFDLGLGRNEARFCVRCAPGATQEALTAASGTSLLSALPRIGHVLVEEGPPRVVESVLGRIEVLTPIPSPGGTSPLGSHTHLLPDHLATGRALPAGMDLPRAYVPGAIFYPAG